MHLHFETNNRYGAVVGLNPISLRKTLHRLHFSFSWGWGVGSIYSIRYNLGHEDLLSDAYTQCVEYGQ